MKDILRAWDSDLVYGKKYDIYRVIDDCDAFLLYLQEEDGKQRLILRYECLIFSYKMIYEGMWLETFSELSKIYGSDFITENTFFRVDDSSYAIEIEKNCYGTISANDMYHIKIISSNSIYDIVSYGEPVLYEDEPAIEKNEQERKNKLIYLSGEEMEEKLIELHRDQNRVIIEIDSRECPTLKSYLREITKAFHMPSQERDDFYDYDRYWKDLRWIREEKIAFVICHFSEFLKKELIEKSRVIEHLDTYILPWWEYGVVNYTVLGKVREFMVYLVD